MNNKSLLLSIFCTCLLTLGLLGQTVFVVDRVPSDTPSDAAIFISGNFEGWSGGAPTYQLSRDSAGLYSISFNRTSGSIQFKFTKGSWASVEKGPNGEEIANRQYSFTPQADTVRFQIASWADGSAGSTAADNVFMAAENFSMQPYFNRTRKIWVYLPPSYETAPDKRYPVLYMQDAQNLFDRLTSFAGEWEVDETLNQLYEDESFELIVVGIENGRQHRIGEYTPWPHPNHGGGDGAKYVDFVAESVKPWIDAQYRTRPEVEHTGIMGSSLGALISHYAAVERSDVFSKVGAFSPSYWFHDSIYAYTEAQVLPDDMRFYLLAGDQESSTMVGDMERMAALLQEQGLPDEQLVSRVIPGGGHNEALWRSQFREAVLWLYKDLSSDVLEKKTIDETWVRLYPNPSSGMLFIDMDLELLTATEVSVLSIDGSLLWSGRMEASAAGISLHHLTSGLYIVQLNLDGSMYSRIWVKGL